MDQCETNESVGDASGETSEEICKLQQEPENQPVEIEPNNKVVHEEIQVKVKSRINRKSTTRHNNSRSHKTALAIDKSDMCTCFKHCPHCKHNKPVNDLSRHETNSKEKLSFFETHSAEFFRLIFLM